MTTQVAKVPTPLRLMRREAIAIPGWTADDRSSAFETFQRSAQEILEQGSGFLRAVQFGGSRQNWRAVCEAAVSGADPADFFERWFVPYAVVDELKPSGLFTGYFEPEVIGSRTPNARFTVPIYGRPKDLITFTEEEKKEIGLSYGRRVDGQLQPYFTRAEIESGSLDNQGLELVWLNNWADAFFIHIQGSARIRFADESVLRLTFAAKSGRPYTSIGNLLVERGIISREDMSMQSIRAWMIANPRDARKLMWENQSFIFFREAQIPDPTLGPCGAQHVQLTPRRSVAIDRSLWMFGTPVWLDCHVPPHDEAPDGHFRSLMIAQDTGSAILGGARADVFWGFGGDAGAIAGKMNATGHITVFLPRSAALELGLS